MSFYIRTFLSKGTQSQYQSVRARVCVCVGRVCRCQQQSVHKRKAYEMIVTKYVTRSKSGNREVSMLNNGITTARLSIVHSTLTNQNNRNAKKPLTFNSHCSRLYTIFLLPQKSPFKNCVVIFFPFWIFFSLQTLFNFHFFFCLNLLFRLKKTHRISRNKNKNMNLKH